MKPLIKIIILLLVTNFSYSQNKSDKTPVNKPKTSLKNSNFIGWQDLSWESTEATVKQKYNGQLSILPTIEKYGESYCPFEIQNYELGFDTFKVSFLFNEKTKKLVQVNVKKEDPINIRKTVQNIEVSLTEKYGKPIIKEESPEYITKWLFPELSIQLSYVDMKAGGVQISKTIFLIYKNPEKTKINKF